MLSGLFDESGTHADSHAVSVAGYVATAEAWVDLAKAWEELLHEDKLSVFHMTQLMKLKKHRGGVDRANKRFDRYIKLVNEAAIVGVGVVLDREAYRRHVTTPQDMSFFGNEYTLCAMAILGHVGRWADRNDVDEGIAYTFELGAKGCDEFVSTYRKAYQDPALVRAYRLLGDVSLRDKSSYRPVQSADIPAYLMHKAWPSGRDHESVAPILYELQAMHRVKQHRWTWINDEIMRRLKLGYLKPDALPTTEIPNDGTKAEDANDRQGRTDSDTAA